MKVKVVAWFGNHDDAGNPSYCVLFTGQQVLEGIGPRQREALLPPQTTIGALRDEWGDPSVGEGLPDNTIAWSYGGEGLLDFVVVEVDLA